MSNDFVLSDGGANVELLNDRHPRLDITFVDTGLRRNIGERLRAVRHHVEDEEMFLANYGDGLTDADLPAMIDASRRRAARWPASSRCARSYSFHVVVDGRRRPRAARCAT